MASGENKFDRVFIDDDYGRQEGLKYPNMGEEFGATGGPMTPTSRSSYYDKGGYEGPSRPDYSKMENMPEDEKVQVGGSAGTSSKGGGATTQTVFDENPEPDPEVPTGPPGDNDTGDDFPGPGGGDDTTSPPPQQDEPIDVGVPPHEDEPIPYPNPDDDFTIGDPAEDFIGDGMDFTVPGAEDVDTPTSSGTADPTMTPWDVTSEQTVAGQFEDLYNRDSPIFELARQRAIRQHLSSGGQNSAMAAGFGEIAAMDKAFQMAQQDAATYARSAEFNAAMSNQYSLAEQRFIQNAILSDQAFEHAKSLQTQRIAAQLESIVLDYKGRSLLMDKELDQWMTKAAKEFEYEMQKLDFQLKGELQMLNVQALANFWVNGFNAVMQIAGNPNLTAEQSRKAMQQGMEWFAQQRDAFAAFMESIIGQSSQSADFSNYNWMTGFSESFSKDTSGYPNWGDWSNYNNTQPP